MMATFTFKNHKLNDFFMRVAKDLEVCFGHSAEDSEQLVNEYYKCFTDESFCRSIGLRVRDEDYFFHEATEGIALEIQYYIKLKKRGGLMDFINWRKSFYESRRGA